jgi:hypothetical protein
VDRPRAAVSAGQSRLGSVVGFGFGTGFDDNPAIAPNPPIPAIVVVVFDGPASSFPVAFFLIFILPQSCHVLQTLQTLPSASSIRPGGRFGWVSLVVRITSFVLLELDILA